MTSTNTNVVAKIAAVVAGLGLVAMSFASFAPAKAATDAEMQAQITQLLPTNWAPSIPAATGMPEPRRRHARDTASLAVTQRIALR